MWAGPVYGYRSMCGYRRVRGGLVGVYVCGLVRVRVCVCGVTGVCVG